MYLFCFVKRMMMIFFSASRSLGIVTYVLLSGHSPFGGDDKQQTYSNITSSDLEFPDKLFGHISDDAKNFIRKLLNRDPKYVFCFLFHCCINQI